MTAEAHLKALWMYLTFYSFIGLCLSLWKGHFVEIWYQMTAMLAQLCFCIQVVKSLWALLWELCMVLCVCCPRWWLVLAVHFLHLCVPYTKAVAEESGFQLEKQVPARSSARGLPNYPNRQRGDSVDPRVFYSMYSSLNSRDDVMAMPAKYHHC